MDDRDLTFIQDQIGYVFQNTNLLQQAFIRKSYSQENGGENNEVLEFIGDKVLDIAVVRYLCETYGWMCSEAEDFNIVEDWNEFRCDLSEGELTETKKKLVEKKMLAHRIDVLGLSDYLIMGRGDIRNNLCQEPSVKEDLFEAILGAVALDSNWDFERIQSAIEVMLDPESELEPCDDENYVGKIQNWTEQHFDMIPWYHYRKSSYQTSWYMPFDGISQKIPLQETGIEKLQYTCLLKISNSDDYPIFRGFGASKSEARRGACMTAYQYLEQNDLLDSIRYEIDNPNKAEAINQLETLSRRGYFSLPFYTFEQYHDDNGNPVWQCECKIEEYDNTFQAESSSKKDAKKTAAFEMLKYILE